MAAIDTRIVAAELQTNVSAIKTAVDALKAEVDAIEAVTSTWVVNSDDLSLPAELDVQAQLTAYEGLSTVVSKPSNSLNDSIATIKAAV